MKNKNEIYLFPLAFLLNASSMTILLIGVGLAGKTDLAADIAIIQGASLAVFFTFSANARNIILGESSRISWHLILRSRVLLMVPLGGAAVLVSLYFADVPRTLVLVLVLRRCSEWISEVYLARMEREKSYDFALRFTAIQSLLLGIAMVGVIADFGYADLGLFLWALLPLLLTGGFLMRHFRVGNLLDSGWVHMLPHFGSTAITGIAVFVFRLVILLLVGKAYAGNLFTAFAIGGILGSVFGQAIGPTLVFHAKEGLKSDLPRWLKACLFGSVGVGIALVLASVADWQVLVESGRPTVFWSALGASLIGGAVMALAYRFRLRLLQHYENGDAFGPDVLTNIFIVSYVPYVYYLLGVDALSWLLLFNAVIAVVFYASADRTAPLGRKITSLDSPMLKKAIAVGLVLPVFFQLAGRIFRDKRLLLDSGGDLLNLPIPISVLFLYGGIIVIGSYSRARASLSIVFLSFSLMLLSTALSTQGDGVLQQAKIILLIQFILPMLGLVLGQTYEGSPGAEGNIAKAFLYVIALIVPLQLMATLIQNLPYLSGYLYFFSIYQHIQYVSLVFVCGFVIACFSLWQDKAHRTVLVILAIPIGAYAVLSVSMLTVGALLTGSITFISYRYLRKLGKDQKGPLFLVLLIAIGIFGGLPVVKQQFSYTAKVWSVFDTLSGVSIDDDNSWRNRLLENERSSYDAASRRQIWQLYIDKIASSDNEWAFGFQSPPDRKLYPSAHNYYLDFVYNFGLVALVPILWLIGFTLWQSGRHWRRISADPGFFVLTGAVLFLLLVDNSLKVGLRQPYPGIVTFFLWGVLISRLGELGRTPGTHGAEG